MKYYGKGERFIMHNMRLSRKLLHVSMAAAVIMSSFGMIPVIAEETEEAEETAAESVEETEEAELTAVCTASSTISTPIAFYAFSAMA